MTSVRLPDARGERAHDARLPPATSYRPGNPTFAPSVGCRAAVIGDGAQIDYDTGLRPPAPRCRSGIGWPRLALVPETPPLRGARTSSPRRRPSSAWRCCRSRPPPTCTCSGRRSSSSSPGGPRALAASAASCPPHGPRRQARAARPAAVLAVLPAIIVGVPLVKGRRRTSGSSTSWAWPGSGWWPTCGARSFDQLLAALARPSTHAATPATSSRFSADVLAVRPPFERDPELPPRRAHRRRDARLLLRARLAHVARRVRRRPADAVAGRAARQAAEARHDRAASRTAGRARRDGAGGARAASGSCRPTGWSAGSRSRFAEANRKLHPDPAPQLPRARLLLAAHGGDGAPPASPPPSGGSAAGSSRASSSRGSSSPSSPRCCSSTRR